MCTDSGGRGQTSACQSDATTLQTAEESYSANNDSYTTSQGALVAAGLMHAASARFTISLLTPSGAAASYKLTGVSTGDCTGHTCWFPLGPVAPMARPEPGTSGVIRPISLFHPADGYIDEDLLQRGCPQHSALP
ncbi:MAG: hypothetical protein ABIZ69_06965, partial [Ilumatobacteraceae bacterium]